MSSIDVSTLADLLSDVGKGRLQAPRTPSTSPGEETVRLLLEAVLDGMPTGFVTLLEIPREGSWLPTAPFPGVEEKKNTRREAVVIHGCDLLAALHGAAASAGPFQVLDASGNAVPRFFYVDVEAFLSPFCTRARVLPVAEDRLLQPGWSRGTRDLSRVQEEFSGLVFPAGALFDTTRQGRWLRECRASLRGQPERAALLDRFEAERLKPLHEYSLPVCRISASAPLLSVARAAEVPGRVPGAGPSCIDLICSAVSSGGPDVAGDLALRLDGGGERIGLRSLPVLPGLSAFDFLEGLSLLERCIEARREGGSVEWSRDSVCRIAPDSWNGLADSYARGLSCAAGFMSRLHVLDRSTLPHDRQLTLLSVICAILGPDCEKGPAGEMLARWFWRSSFNCELDADCGTSPLDLLLAVLGWIDGGAPPRYCDETPPDPSAVFDARPGAGPLARAVKALLVRAGSRSPVTGTAPGTDGLRSGGITFHPLFPRSYFEKEYVDSGWHDSIANMVLLSADDAAAMDGAMPSEALGRLAGSSGMSPEEIDSILASHLVDAALLRAGDFGPFARDRARRIASAAAEAMGIPVEETIPAGEPEPSGGIGQVAGETDSPGEGGAPSDETPQETGEPAGPPVEIDPAGYFGRLADKPGRVKYPWEE